MFVKLGAVCVYVDGVFELVWEVMPFCMGRYTDLVLFFEVNSQSTVRCPPREGGYVYESHYRPLNAQFSQSISDSRWGDVVEDAFYV